MKFSLFLTVLFLVVTALVSIVAADPEPHPDPFVRTDTVVKGVTGYAYFPLDRNIPCSFYEYLGGEGFEYGRHDTNSLHPSHVFLQAVVTNVEQTLNWKDFRFSITERQQWPNRTGLGFAVIVTPSGSHRLGPSDDPETLCISCHHSPVSQVSALTPPYLDPYKTNLWLDAQARPMIVATPRYHAQRLSELKSGGPEMAALFRTGLEFIHGQLVDDQTREFVSTMIVNHGRSRNVSHLHLKIWLEPWAWSQMRNGWSPEMVENWRALESGLYERMVRGVQKTSGS